MIRGEESAIFSLVFMLAMEMMDASCTRIDFSQYSVDKLRAYLLDRRISYADNINHSLIVSYVEIIRS